MLIAIAAGQFDVAADGITYTTERDKTVDFSQLYQSYDEALLVRDPEDRFKTVEELKAIDGYLVGTQTGTTNSITAENLFGKDHIKLFDEFGAVVEALKNDDVDAVVIDRPAGQGYAARGGLQVLDEAISGVEGLAFAYPPGSDLVNPINAAMSALQASGKWDEIYAKWFPGDGSDVCSSS
ncbi:MAG: transporter substrate-binding domain-containing protein [Anaerolineae bacterium]